MRKLRFLHIPKTAGTTFTTVLKRQYGKQGRFKFGNDILAAAAKFQALSEDEKQKITLITGHVPLRTGIPDIDAFPVITLLRDPIERVKSFCQHVSEGKSPYLLEESLPKTFDLDRFLQSGNLELFNMQTNMLISNSCYLSSAMTHIPASDAKDMALEALFQKILCFGLTEYFDESLLLFKERLGWTWPFYTTRNQKDQKKLITFEDRHLQKIIELNRIDLEVYNTAKKEFPHRLSGIPSFKWQLLQFKTLSKMRQLRIRLR